MGYQVGNQCFSTLDEAKNHYFSLITPSVSANGKKLIKPEYDGKNWTLDGKTLDLRLPECDPLKNFTDGAELGWLILGVMASLYVFRVIRGLLK